MTQLHPAAFQDRMHAFANLLRRAPLRPVMGTVTEVKEAIVHARLPYAAVGAICEIRNGATRNLAEIVGLVQDTAILSPLDGGQGLSTGLPVRIVADGLQVPVGKALLGRVLNGIGAPIDQLGAVAATAYRKVRATTPDAISRPLIDQPLATGVRAIDAFCTVGRGQRLGIFGPPGVGKSVLLSALARNSDADAIVIGLVGERGREVREFIDRSLPMEHRTRTVVVAATSDRPPLERLYAAQTATVIAEALRDEGLSVLLLIDSLTRVARALREIGLAAGEPPTRRGYPASVYAALPQLIERSGRTVAGDITALYTVLVEGDGEGDPIAEEVRSLTDGHIRLSADIAEKGRYPAIDVLNSLSRLMADIAPPEARAAARQARAAMAKYAEIELLIQVGEYQPGSDQAADDAIAMRPALEDFLTQNLDESPEDLASTFDQLAQIMGATGSFGWGAQ